MLACKKHEDPHSLYARYVRDCVFVARFGMAEIRQNFVSQYEQVLGGTGVWLRSLPATHQGRVFLDAVRAKDGGLPRTLAGLRLAMPRWFTRRIDHPWAAWEELAGFRPTGLAIDPVCHMYVDPGTTPYRIVEGGQESYFCCPHCLAIYGDRLLRSA